jgi:hypothetical protein
VFLLPEHQAASTTGVMAVTQFADRLGRIASMVAATGLVVASALFGLPPARAADSPSATFAPAELQMAEGRTREAVLSVSNPTDRVVSDLDVRVRSDPGLEFEVTAHSTGLAAGSSTAIPVSVTRTAEAAASATVVVIVDYTIGTGANAAASSAVATLSVDAPEAATTRSAEVNITAAGATEELIQYQETDLFFTIANPGDSAQVVHPIVISYPSYLTVSYKDPAGDEIEGKDGSLRIDDFATLEPGDGQVVHLGVAADQPLQPGNALVHITARARDRTDGSVGTAVSSQTIKLQVLGESGVLTLLGVPALLFVPGLVWILVLWTLWRYVYPRRAFALNPGSDGSLIEGKVALWVFALLPSLLFPFLYPALTSLLGQERDYRKAYGLDDILYVWIMAAVAAVLVWGVAVAGRQTYLALFIPAEGDEPLQLLAKYVRRPWRRALPTEGAFHNGTQRVHCLTDRRKEKVLVVPTLAYQTAGLSEAEQQAVATLASSESTKLWRIFRKRPELLTYQTAGGTLNAPTVVPKEQLSNRFTDKLWTPSMAVAATADRAAVPASGEGRGRE